MKTAKLTQFPVLISIYLRSFIIFSYHLRLGLHNGLFNIGLPARILKALLPSSILAIWPIHSNLLDLIILTIVGEQYKLWSSHYTIPWRYSPLRLRATPNYWHHFHSFTEIDCRSSDQFMGEVSSSPAFNVFLNRDYRYRSVATQTPLLFHTLIANSFPR